MKSAINAFILCVNATFVIAGESAKPAEVKEPELQRELLRRTKTDQQARRAVIAWIKEHGSNGIVDAAKLTAEEKADYEKLNASVRQADEDNTKWLEEIIAKHGWPGKSLVGKSGANAAWLLVQH